jgi:hypothetical protein
MEQSKNGDGCVCWSIANSGICRELRFSTPVAVCGSEVVVVGLIKDQSGGTKGKSLPMNASDCCNNSNNGNEEVKEGS